MALDMSHGGGSSDWFGFSPIVVITAAAAVLAGGWFFMSSRTDPYAQALTDVCAQHGDWIEKQWAPGGPNRASGPGVDWSNTVFHQVNRSAVARQAAFQAVRAPAAHQAEHAAVLASEQRIAEVSRAAMVRAEQTHSATGAMDNLREIYDENKRESERLVAMGAKMRKFDGAEELKATPVFTDICPL